MKITIEIDESKLPVAYRTVNGNQNIIDLLHDGLVLLPMEKRIGELETPTRFHHEFALEIYTQAEEVGKLLFRNLVIER